MPETQLVIILGHACVATVTSLAEAMIGICIWYLSLSGESLANNLHSLAYSIDKLRCVPWKAACSAACSGLPHDDQSSE